MYRSFRIGKYNIAFHKFQKKTKTVSKVYLTGFRFWDSMDSKNYSVVVWTFRIIFSINKNINSCCN